MQEKKQDYINPIRFKIVSPSANNLNEPEREKLIKNAEQFFHENSWEFEYGELFNSKFSYLSGTAIQRSQELMNAFLDPRINCIISSQGGNNSNDLLPYLDYNLINKNNKPFFGLSDITVLLNVIAVKSKIITYHGLDFLWGIGKNAKDYTKKIMKLICEEKKILPLKNPSTSEWKPIQNGTGTGIILGGCLPSFCLLLGTDYDPLEELNKNFILILEDIGQSKSEIQSLLMQLKQHRKFNLCQGIVFGNFVLCEQGTKDENPSIEEIAKRVFSDNNIPLARIEEIGHAVENMIIPIGGEGRMVCTEKEVQFNFHGNLHEFK